MSLPSNAGSLGNSQRAPFASRPDFGKIGSILDGRYRIEHVIGEGGMGVVAKAVDLRLDRQVAIKLLHSEYADQEDVLERFAREAMVIAKLRSRYVVSVLDVSTDRDKPYLVLEYLEGESLEDRIFRDGPLPIGEAVKYARQVAEALEEAHAAGILHRDIKPANVFLTRQSNHEIIAQILDFGTARFYDAKRDGQLSKPTITKQYETFGSPAYMPPEQISSARNTDERSDVWALGTVLYEAITGQLAFEGEYPEVFVVISTREPPPLRSLRPEAPADLEVIIERCLRKVKEDRYASMTELKRALLSVEQEVLPARARPNYTVPSPAMDGVSRPDSSGNHVHIYGESQPTNSPTSPAPPMRNMMAPTPELPFRPMSLPTLPSTGVSSLAATSEELAGRSNATQRDVPQYDDTETYLEPPAGTEPVTGIRKYAWVGISIALFLVVFFIGTRAFRDAPPSVDTKPTTTASTATPTPTLLPSAEPTLAPEPSAVTQDPAVTPGKTNKLPNGKPVPVVPGKPGQPAVPQPGTQAQPAQPAQQPTPQASKTPAVGPVVPGGAPTPSGDDIGRRK